MIVRIWRGNTRTERADEYEAFTEKRGLGDYRRTPGNRGALLLRQRAARTDDRRLHVCMRLRGLGAAVLLRAQDVHVGQGCAPGDHGERQREIPATARALLRAHRVEARCPGHTHCLYFR